jgi:hypothetical protein
MEKDLVEQTVYLQAFDGLSSVVDAVFVVLDNRVDSVIGNRAENNVILACWLAPASVGANETQPITIWLVEPDDGQITLPGIVKFIDPEIPRPLQLQILALKINSKTHSLLLAISG